MGSDTMSRFSGQLPECRPAQPTSGRRRARGGAKCGGPVTSRKMPMAYNWQRRQRVELKGGSECIFTPLVSGGRRADSAPERGGRRGGWDCGPLQGQAGGARRQVSTQQTREGQARARSPPRCRLPLQAAHLRLRQRRLDRTERRVHGTSRLPHADRRVQRHPEEPLSSLQYLQRRADAVHAAHHLVGRGAARGRGARLSGLARLHPSAHPFAPSCGA